VAQRNVKNKLQSLFVVHPTLAGRHQ